MIFMEMLAEYILLPWMVVRLMGRIYSLLVRKIPKAAIFLPHSEIKSTNMVRVFGK